MPSSFACPACRAVLKTKTELPAGKKVKCPKCATVFAAPDGDATVSAVRSAAPPPRIPLPAGGGAAGERMRSGKPPALAAARRQSAPVEDDEGEDDRPARKRSKKRKKKQNNMVLLLSLGGGGGVLLILLLVLGFVWPGFFLGKEKPTRGAAQVVQDVVLKNAAGLPKGTGEEDLLNFAPQGCNVFAGMDLAFIHQRADLEQQWQMGLAMGLQQVPGAPPGLLEVMADVDRVLMAFNTNEKTGPGGTVNPEGAVILRLKTPSSPQRFLQFLPAPVQPEELKEKTIYRLMSRNDGMQPNPMLPVPILHMPNDRIAIIAFAPQQRLENLLTFTGANPVVSPLAVAEVRSVEKAFMWAALEVTPTIQEFLMKIDPNALAAMGPELKPALLPLQQMKSAAFALELEMVQNAKIKLRLSATCANEADGQKMQAAVKDFWEKKGKMYLGMTKMMMPPNAGPAMGPLLDEMAKNVTVTAQGPQVVLAVELSEKNLQGLQGQGNQFQQLMGGAGAPRPVLQPQQVPPRQGMRPQRGGPPGGRRPVPQPGAK